MDNYHTLSCIPIYLIKNYINHGALQEQEIAHDVIK